MEYWAKRAGEDAREDKRACMIHTLPPASTRCRIPPSSRRTLPHYTYILLPSAEAEHKTRSCRTQNPGSCVHGVKMVGRIIRLTDPLSTKWVLLVQELPSHSEGTISSPACLTGQDQAALVQASAGNQKASRSSTRITMTTPCSCLARSRMVRRPDLLH